MVVNLDWEFGSRATTRLAPCVRAGKKDAHQTNFYQSD